MRLWLVFAAICFSTSPIFAQVCTDYAPPTRFVQRALEDPDVYYFGVDLVGSFLYVTGAAAAPKPYFGIVDITDPLAPVLVGSVSSVDGSVFGSVVGAAGGFAYVVGSGFQVIDVTEPAAPFVVSSIGLPRDGADMSLDGKIAYVALHEWGLISIDVSTPGAPVPLDTLTLGPWAESVVVDRPYAYVGTPSAAYVIDVTDPANLSVVTDVAAQARAVTLGNGYLYAGSSKPHGITVIDVSNPTSPSVVGTAFGQGAEEIVVHGDYLFANSNGNVLLYDVTIPTSPVWTLRTDMYASRTSPRGMAIANGYLFTAAWPGRGIEVGMLGAKEPAGGFLDGATGWHSTRDVRIRGDLAYVGAYSTSGPNYFTLRLFDVSSPASIVPLGVLALPSEASVVDGNGAHAFVGLYDYLASVDIGDVYNPALIGTLQVGYRAEDVVADGTTLLALDAVTGLHVYDASVPSALVEIGFTPLAMTGSMGGLAVDGQYAYVAWFGEPGPSGLEIIDIGIPSQPARIATVDLPGGGERVAVGGGYAYVTYLLGSRLAAVDVSDPLIPVIMDDMGLPDAQEHGHDIALDGDVLYFGSNHTGVCVIDVSDPSHLHAVGSVHPTLVGTPWSGRVEAANGAVFASAMLGQGQLVSYEGQCNIATGVASWSGPEISSLRAYPNPFNPQVVVNFRLQRRSLVRVDIYDIAGKRVRSLLDGVLDAGDQHLQWDGRDDGGVAAASGVYFVRLTTPLGVKRTKVTLLK